MPKRNSAQVGVMEAIESDSDPLKSPQTPAADVGAKIHAKRNSVQVGVMEPIESLSGSPPSARKPSADISLNIHERKVLRVEHLSYDIWVGGLTLLQQLMTANIDCSLRRTYEKRRILDDVSLKVRSGQLLAILGSSGSGKSTLLDVIACRNNGGEIHGTVTINGYPRTAEMIQNISAFVRQSDQLLPNLSVKDTLTFVAKLVFPSSYKKDKIKNKVDNVIAELGLRHVADSHVGGHGVRGISGGERRRVSIGVNMLLNPDVLFLDEPTSGLDSYTAHHLVETLSRLASNNRIVLMSIHQPRSDIYRLFDLIMLLSQGKVLYFGKAQCIVEYFTTLGWPCPQLTNPCDFYVDLCTINRKSDETERETTTRVKQLRQLYDNFDKTDLVEATEDNSTASDSASTVILQQRGGCYGPSRAQQKLKMFAIRSKAGVFRQFWVLLVRSFLNNIEDYGVLGVQALEALCMSFIIGFVFFNLGQDQAAIRDRFGLLYIIVALYPYQLILDVVGHHHRQRKTEYFEMQDGLYSTGPLYFSKVLVELPEHTMFVLMYALPVYFLTGLRQEIEHIGIAMAIIFIVLYCSRSFSFLAAVLMPNYQMSCIFAQTFFTIFLLSSGFIYNLDSLFVGIQWTSYISYLKWGFQALTDNELKGMNFTCDLPIPDSCMKNGTDALRVWSMEGQDLMSCVSVLGAQILLFLILAYIGMKIIPQKPYEAST